MSKSLFLRYHRFLKKPWSEKNKVLRSRFQCWRNAVMPWLPLPVRLPFGGWWLAWNDVCGNAIFSRGFEEAEWHFVDKFLKPGMTVLDIGAHHGFYTLLASFKVGPEGRVIAFEPSPREQRRLIRHLQLNRCRNVQVEPFALGSQNGNVQFFMVEGKDTGCNSLRPPNVSAPVHLINVEMTSLDDYLQRDTIERIDFAKMDVEGAELEILKGATSLLSRTPRPVWLIEVTDIRTAPWGYRANEIIEYLRQREFHWFAPTPNGNLVPLDEKVKDFNCNFIAVPRERLHEVALLIEDT